MTNDLSSELDKRILIFAPVGKDAELALGVLVRTDLRGHVCATTAELCEEMRRGASVVMLTEETLEDAGISGLVECLRAQPAWSDIPILLFADAERSEVYLRTLRMLEGLRNVVLLERPIRLGAVLSLVRSAIRGRQRQFEVRDLLKALATAREEAETANRLKDEFLATLSHELRTPLNAILGWTTMLRDGSVQERHVMRALETIHRNAAAQVQIVNDLLDVSRIVRGQVQLLPRTIALGPLVMLAVESIAPAAEAKDITVTTSLGSSPLYVWGDGDRLQQVFWNKLTNAVKFTSNGGRVDLRVDTEGDQVRISISDTGCGIQPEFLPHVFERFRQGDGSSTRIHGGLGLGLSIVRHLVELHGGRMTAESSGEGMGSSFIVYLPTRQPEQLTPVQTTIPPPKKHHLDLRGVRVLVVDHDRDTRELVRAMLRGTGARVSEADSHEASTRTFVEDRPHVVLADLTAPGQEGYAVLRAIRSLPDGSGLQTPFIALTAYAGDEEAHRALKVGFDGHVAKPVQADDLLSAIEHVRTTVLAAVLTGNEQGAKVH